MRSDQGGRRKRSSKFGNRIFHFLGIGPGGNWRGQSPVEYRGNQRPHVLPLEAYQRQAQAPKRQVQASQTLAQAYQRLIPASQRLAQASQELTQVSQRLAKASQSRHTDSPCILQDFVLSGSLWGRCST